MSDLPNTRERILEVSLRLFNERGYAATSLADIASSVGIAKGNLTYHFPTKYDLVVECAERARKQRQANQPGVQPGSLADEYVGVVHTAMEQNREFRFLNRDRAQFQKRSRAKPDPEAVSEIETLQGLLQRLQDEGMLRRDPGLDLSAIARSVWMVSRFWIDHLDQDMGINRVTWAEQEGGIRQHLSVLMPCLTAAARRQFEAALTRLSAMHVAIGDE